MSELSIFVEKALLYFVGFFEDQLKRALFGVDTVFYDSPCYVFIERVDESSRHVVFRWRLNHLLAQPF